MLKCHDIMNTKNDSLLKILCRFIDLLFKMYIDIECILYNNEHKPSRAFISTNKSKLTVINKYHNMYKECCSQCIL